MPALVAAIHFFLMPNQDVDGRTSSATTNESSAKEKQLEADHFGVGLLCGSVEFVHAAELHALVERAEAARLDTGLARPQRHVGVARDLLIAVGRPDRHQLGAGAFDR